MNTKKFDYLIVLILFAVSQGQSQNVGIGTTNPNQIFTVAKNGIGLTQATADQSVQVGFFTATSLGAFLQTHSNHDLQFTTNNGTSQMILKTNGNVGIGTTNPQTKLDVNGQIKISGGSPGVGKVLTSDANGLATWQAANNVGNYGTVTNPVTGKTWLDRNLGASQVATSSTDVASYGDLYQWGRNADGHQIRTSGTTTTQASYYFTAGGKFITNSSNWLFGATPPTDLWSGTAGENNPCPSGFRIPTAAEWEQERRTWTSNNAAGAFASPLKLPVAGYRDSSSGSLAHVGGGGYYWSSSVIDTNAHLFSFTSSTSYVNFNNWVYGCSVRCIKD